MDVRGFEVEASKGSLFVEDGDFSVGVNSGNPDIQLLTDGDDDGEVVVSLEEVDVEGDLEVVSPGTMIDVFGVVIKAFEAGYWFEIGSTTFLYASDARFDTSWLEGEVDVAVFEPEEDLVLEAVRIRPEKIIVTGDREFAAELRDRNFDVDMA